MNKKIVMTNVAEINIAFKDFSIVWAEYSNYYNSLACNKGLRDNGKKKGDGFKASNESNFNPEAWEEVKQGIISKFTKPKGLNTTFVKDIKSGKEHAFSREENRLGHFLRAVYQVRCNLFEGKDGMLNDHAKLAAWASESLELLMLKHNELSEPKSEKE